MPELMRWRVARGAQRRIPSPETILPLGYNFDPGTTEKLTSLKDHPDPENANWVTYLRIVSSESSLRQYVAGASNVFSDLINFDRWLASVDNLPSSIAVLQQKAAVFNPYFGNGQWQALKTILNELYYAVLIISVNNISLLLIDAQGILSRWLLVIGLVDLLQPPSPIQTPQDAYNALRWRTLVLPDAVWLILLSLRLQRAPAIVRRPGFSDLYITREEWDHYEAAEIASIENIMAHELRSRVHVLVNQTKVTTTVDQTTTTTQEQDTTTTDLNQLQQQSSSDLSLAAHVDGQVDTTGQYGPTQVSTHIGGSLDFSYSNATSKATTQSHETVSRAVSKVEQTTRQIRTTSTLTRSTDREEHKFDNTAQDATNVSGIYRWVDQIQNVALERYPNRFLMEFEVPEPGAWTRWLHLNDVNNLISTPPPPLVNRQGQPLSPDDLTDQALVTSLIATYRVSGVSPLPTEQRLSTVLSADSDPNSLKYKNDTTIGVPNGYYAVSWNATLMYSPTGDPTKTGLDQAVYVSVGAGQVYMSTPNSPNANNDHSVVYDSVSNQRVGPISIGDIPVYLQAVVVAGYEVGFEVICDPLDSTLKQWRLDTYSRIAAAYDSELADYKANLSGLTVQQTNLANTFSPEQNAVIIRKELKRQVIEMLIGQRLQGRDALNWDGQADQMPTTDLVKAANFAPEIQFLEQAFEWETLSYICYPYYWATVHRWGDLAKIVGNDPNFVDFLTAGSARVVLAARPGFECQVNLYTMFGILWGGGAVPAPNDENYLSIADEIREQQQGPLDVTIVDTWQVRLPTTLIWLQSDGALPSNPSPSIVLTPNITSLMPAAGPVGTTVYVMGDNLGSGGAGSSITFNGVAANPSNWSANLIQTPVPANATTGPVVVTVGGVSSGAVTFTVG